MQLPVVLFSPPIPLGHSEMPYAVGNLPHESPVVREKIPGAALNHLVPLLHHRLQLSPVLGVVIQPLVLLRVLQSAVGAAGRSRDRGSSDSELPHPGGGRGGELAEGSDNSGIGQSVGRAEVRGGAGDETSIDLGGQAAIGGDHRDVRPAGGNRVGVSGQNRPQARGQRGPTALVTAVSCTVPRAVLEVFAAAESADVDPRAGARGGRATKSRPGQRKRGRRMATVAGWTPASDDAATAVD